MKVVQVKGIYILSKESAIVYCIEILLCILGTKLPLHHTTNGNNDK